MSDFLGIEIGGTKLQLGVGPGDGTIRRLARLEVIPAGGAERIRGQIAAAARELGGDFAAIGIGFGGPVDPARGIVTVSNQIDGWRDFPLVPWMRQTLGVREVGLRNDADTAALGESRFGAGRGVSPVLYVNSGSGIGGGLVVDGRIYGGSGGGAVEIGHLIVREATGESPALTLESIASGWGIGQAGGAGGDARVVAEAARRGDLPARGVLQRAVEAMATALGHAITLLAPRRVVLGGGVSLMGDDLWLDPIRTLVDRRVFPPFRGTYDVRLAELGEDVVVHGALALARDLVERPQ